MPEFYNTILWVDDIRSSIYMSFYTPEANDPLAKLKVNKVNHLLTYEGEPGNWGPSYDDWHGKPDDSDIRLNALINDIVSHNFFTALQAIKDHNLKLYEIKLTLENGTKISTLLPGDLYLKDSCQKLVDNLVAYYFKTDTGELVPFRIYLLNENDTTLLETRYITKNIEDFVTGRIGLFVDITEEESE